MSQKSRTFANVIELDRHIEILLLSNDCVIVPELGGFMAHHVEARYDEDDAMFLPPQRTLGFNPQLKLNDSLLVQSYVEAYDISYPEALRRIESEVAELRQHLDNDGFYEMNDLGQLFINREGKLEFAPCEAGILTPEFYGLSSFEIKPLVPATVDVVQAEHEKQATLLPLKPENAEITIKMSWVRNAVAVAAALVAFLLMTKPVNEEVQTGLSMSQINLPIIQKETPKRPTVPVAEIEPAVVKAEQPAAKAEQPAPKAEQPAPKAEQPAPKAEQPAAVKPAVPAAKFCIVVASQVSKKGADEFVAKLQAQGYASARVYLYNKVRRVVIGSYQTEAQAYKALQDVHANQELAEAWVFEANK